jgi:hypothetical protein
MALLVLYFPRLDQLVEAHHSKSCGMQISAIHAYARTCSEFVSADNQLITSNHMSCLQVNTCHTYYCLLAYQKPSYALQVKTVRIICPTPCTSWELHQSPLDYRRSSYPPSLVVFISSMAGFRRPTRTPIPEYCISYQDTEQPPNHRCIP